MASIGKAEDWPWKTEAAEAFATDEHGRKTKQKHSLGRKQKH